MDDKKKFKMIELLNKEGYAVLEKWRYAEFKKNYKFFIETEEGRDILKSNHFVSRLEVKSKCSQAFNHGFQCLSCDYFKNNEHICIPCRKLQNIIKSM